MEAGGRGGGRTLFRLAARGGAHGGDRYADDDTFCEGSERAAPHGPAAGGTGAVPVVRRDTTDGRGPVRALNVEGIRPTLAVRIDDATRSPDRRRGQSRAADIHCPRGRREYAGLW